MHKNKLAPDSFTTIDTTVTPDVKRYHAAEELYNVPPVTSSEIATTTNPKYVIVQKSADTQDVVVVLNLDLSDKEHAIRRANDMLKQKLETTSVSSGS